MRADAVDPESLLPLPTAVFHILVALADRPAPVNLSRIVHKGPRIVGVLGSHMPRAIELLSTGVVRIDGLITHEFPLTEIQQAFAVILAGFAVKLALSEK